MKPVTALLLIFLLIFLEGCGLFDSSEEEQLVFPSAISFPTMLQPNQELIIEIGYQPISEEANYSAQISGSGINYEIELSLENPTVQTDSITPGLTVIPFSIGSGIEGDYSITLRGPDGDQLTLTFPVKIDSTQADFLIQSNGHGQDLSSSGNPDTLQIGLFGSREINGVAPIDTIAIVRDNGVYQGQFPAVEPEYYFVIEPSQHFFSSGLNPNAFRITRLAPQREVRFLQYLL